MRENCGLFYFCLLLENLVQDATRLCTLRGTFYMIVKKFVKFLSLKSPYLAPSSQQTSILKNIHLTEVCGLAYLRLRQSWVHTFLLLIIS